MSSEIQLYRDHGAFCGATVSELKLAGEEAEIVTMDYIIDNLNHANAGDYRIIANYNVPFEKDDSAGVVGDLEIDLLLICKMGIFLIEVKSWKGRFVGYENEWVRGSTVYSNPIGVTNSKAKVFHGRLGKLFRDMNNVSVVGLVVLTEEDTFRNYEHKQAAHKHLVNTLNGTLISRLTTKEILHSRSSRELNNTEIDLIFKRFYTDYRPPKVATIGHYEIVETMLKGELYDEAYHVRNPHNGVKRRIKRYTVPRVSKNDHTLRHFKQNATALSRIGVHPNIFQYVDYFPHHEQDHIYYEVTEFPDGTRLDELLEENEKAKKKIPLTMQLSIIRQVAEALDHAHQFKVVHRNLNPEVIYIQFGRNMENRVDVKVGDFDFSKVEGVDSISQMRTRMMDNNDEPKTRTLVDNFCTAPELNMNSLAATPKSDVYSLGVCWYLMTQTHTRSAGFHRKRDVAPDKDRLEQLDLSADVKELINSMMNKVFASRPTMREVIEKIDDIK